MVEVMKIMVYSFKRPHAGTVARSAPKPTTGHHPCLHWRLLDTHMQVWVSLCGVTAPLFWVMVPTWFYLCPARVCFPVLCKFWQPYSGVNCDLLQEDICHTQVSCTQSLYPCNSPLFTCTFAGDTLTQFCLSLCGVSGSWWAQGLFEPSEHLCQVWGLTLNIILPLLPSCWGFSFAHWMWGISSKWLKVYININDQFIKWPYL